MRVSLKRSTQRHMQRTTQRLCTQALDSIIGIVLPCVNELDEIADRRGDQQSAVVYRQTLHHLHSAKELLKEVNYYAKTT